MTWQGEIFIDGAWSPTSAGGVLPVIDPATAEPCGTIARGGPEDIDRAVAAARRAGPGWAATTGRERAVFLRAMAAAIRRRRDALARLEVVDMGKPIREAELDIADAERCFDYYAGLAEELDTRQDGPVEVADPDFTSRVRYDPVGAAALITPWNFPFLIAAFKVAPCLAAGATAVLKPSEHASLSTLALGDIAREVGLPAGVLNIVTGLGAEVGDPLTAHPGIAKVSFTGSKPTATRIMRNAADRMARTTFELGGKGPILVFDDADLDKALEWILFGVFFNQGEVCSATTRLLIQEGAAARLLPRLIERAAALRVGPGSDPATQVGPIAFEAQHRKIEAHIEAAVAAGARLACGGTRPPGLDKGYFISPAVFTDVATDLAIWREEVFGPVLCVRTFRDEAQAVAEANDTDFGLSAAVVSGDPQRCKRVARALDAGVVWVNCSQPALIEAPWGGRKQSGIGREFGRWGLENFLDVKQITTFERDATWDWYRSAEAG